MDGNWQIYGCSLGVHPQTDDIYASVYHGFTDPTYETMRFDSSGNLINEYAMISNYWFPSMFVFPTTPNLGSGVETIQPDTEDNTNITYHNGYLVISGSRASLAEVYDVSGQLVAKLPVYGEEECSISITLHPGIYIISIGSSVTKLKI